VRTSYDSINVRALPAGADLYLGYDDGNWPDADEIARTFPGKTVIRTTVNPADNEGDCLDVEKGDATPNDAPGWIQRRREAGHQGPLVYCSEALRSAVVAAFASARIPLPGLFIAAYPGEGPVLQRPTDVGHQYASNANYDTSVVVDYLPGIDPAPATPSSNPAPSSAPTPQETSMAITPKFIHNGQQNIVQASAGSLWHKYLSVDGWRNETLAGPEGGSAAGCADHKVTVAASQPGITLNADGSVDITFEGTDESAWNVAQASGSSEWFGGRVP
jgi:hypothetical protein